MLALVLAFIRMAGICGSLSAETEKAELRENEQSYDELRDGDGELHRLAVMQAEAEEAASKAATEAEATMEVLDALLYSDVDEQAEASREVLDALFSDSDKKQPESGTGLPMLPLAEVNATMLDARSFFEQYLRPGKPVILRDGALVNGWADIIEQQLWSDKNLLSRIGDEPIDESLLTNTARDGGTNAAALARKNRKPWTWADFLTNYQKQDDKLYVSTDLPKT